MAFLPLGKGNVSVYDKLNEYVHTIYYTQKRYPYFSRGCDVMLVTSKEQRRTCMIRFQLPYRKNENYPFRYRTRTFLGLARKTNEVPLTSAAAQLRTHVMTDQHHPAHQP